jgi:hypothetical protein
MNASRRHFLSSAASVGLGFAALHRLTGCEKVELETDLERYNRRVKDPTQIFAVPPGFTVLPISRAGEPMSDGLITPGSHDGMCAFPGPGGKTVLVCNHELDAEDYTRGPFGARNELLAKVDVERLYDRGSGQTPGLGGTTTLVYDTRARTVEREFLSLAGTLRNCAGGPTPWGTWVTCEESVKLADDKLEEDHGYNFEVPARADGGLAPAVPLLDMGRFNHEAVAVDPRTGIVYQTEDRGEGLIYRYIPRRPGRLADGGRLQALRVRDQRSLDTRNWTKRRVTTADRLAVDWVDLDDIHSPTDELRMFGFYGGGAARFARGEGMWFGRGCVYFACTNGGKEYKGQIWRYTPSPDEGRPGEQHAPGRLELFVEPNDGNVIENADNLTMAPNGDVYVCEDSGRDVKRIVRVTRTGRIIEFGRNIINRSELAGVTFSPDGTTLFVNIQNPGLTLAITGDWNALSV